MGLAQRVLSVGGLVLKATSALGRLVVMAASLKRSRRAAIRGFERGLAQMGVPSSAIEELASAYPDIDLKEFVVR